MRARSTGVQLTELIRHLQKLELSGSTRHRECEIFREFSPFGEDPRVSRVRMTVPDGSKPGPVPPLQTSFVFRAYLRNGSALGFRRRLGPAAANKSRNTEVPRTWEFHVCRWNLISAAFVMEHDRPFSTLLRLPRASFRFSRRDTVEQHRIDIWATCLPTNFDK